LYSDGSLQKKRVGEEHQHGQWIGVVIFSEFSNAGGYFRQIWSISKKYIPLNKGITMKNLSLKLEDDIFQETEKIITKVKKNRNRYINEAIEFYNRIHKRRLLLKQLSKESKIVANDSLKVLAEFERLNDED